MRNIEPIQEPSGRRGPSHFVPKTPQNQDRPRRLSDRLFIGVAISTVVLGLVSTASACHAADENERPPIEYSRSIPDNCVSKLQSRLESGQSQLSYADALGYLPALLEALEVPVESQVLVFSKTSLQRHRISPRTPRAIYFNDNLYVGYCKSGDVLEVSVADAQLGAVFYTVDQKPDGPPTFLRQTENCLLCHSS